MWMTIIFHYLSSGKHMAEITRRMVYLIKALMHYNIEINVGDVIISIIKKVHFCQGHRYGFGDLMTRFLRMHALRRKS